jgi:hypothetical protein
LLIVGLVIPLEVSKAFHFVTGGFDAAYSAACEAAPGASAALHAWRGLRPITEVVLQQVTRDTEAHGEDGSPFVNYCASILNNGLGDYPAALAASRATAYAPHLLFLELVLPELVESAVRLGARGACPPVHSFTV